MFMELQDCSLLHYVGLYVWLLNKKQTNKQKNFNNIFQYYCFYYFISNKCSFGEK